MSCRVDYNLAIVLYIQADGSRGVLRVLQHPLALSYGTSFVQGGWSLLPEYFFHCLHENQVVCPNITWFIARKWLFEKF